MAEQLHQGDIIKLEKIKHPVLVVSKDFFNASGEIIGCPIFDHSIEGPLHILISTDETTGCVQCEKLDAWSERDFKQYLDMFSLDPKQKINTLSKGMRMKYALALALSHEAELLIMDEPTSGLDPLVRSQLLQILTDYMNKGGKGVFFSTHITSDLDKIADMLIMIDNGRIVFQEEKDALLDTYRIVKGDDQALTADVRKLFLNISETAFGFIGVTKQAAEVQRYVPDAMIERPTIEDIMLGNIEGGNK